MDLIITDIIIPMSMGQLSSIKTKFTYQRQKVSKTLMYSGNAQFDINYGNV